MHKEDKPFSRSNKEEIISALWFIVGFLSMAHVYAWVSWLIFLHATLSLLASLSYSYKDSLKRLEGKSGDIDTLNKGAAIINPETKAPI